MIFAQSRRGEKIQSKKLSDLASLRETDKIVMKQKSE